MASTSIEIARSPEVVFDFMTDPANLSRWQDAESVEQLTDGPVAAGTRFREVHRMGGRRRVEETEVVEHDRPRVFHIRVLTGPPVDGRWELAATPSGTRLTLTPLAHLPGPAKALNGLVQHATALAFRRFHRRLKRAVESAR